MPENIYTNNDVYDLYKDLYSEIIQKRCKHKGLNAVNESAEAIILGMNMVSAFEQYADFMFDSAERTDSTLTPLMMYGNGADDLMRYGIISYDYTLSPSSIGSYFFLSNYIVKSMESSYKMYGYLCKIIHGKELILIKFINGRMKDSTLFHEIDFGRPSFTQKYNKEHSKLAFDDVMYLFHENAILLLCFILQSLERPQAPKKEECFSECSILSKASEKCLRCVIEILWNISNEMFIEYLAQADALGFNPFQYAFMNFPQNDMDVVRDTTTNVYQLSNSLRTAETFNEVLEKPIHEKYQNSTLSFYVDKILGKFTDNGRNMFIYQYSTPAPIFEYNISRKHFDETIERKWIAMELLNFPTTDWMQLTTKTIFQNVVCIIFNEFNNNIVVKFYKWAENKIKNNDVFNSFVTDTFVNFFWNCTSERHGQEIIDFVRSKINIEEALRQQGSKVLNKMFEKQFSGSGLNHSFQNKFIKNISICQTLFTKEEYEIVLFHKTENHEGNIISKVCESGDDETIYQIFGTVPLTKIVKNAKEDENLVYALMVYMIGTLDEIRDETLIKFITNFIDGKNYELINYALCITTLEGSFFHLAFLKRNMFMVQLVWKMAKQYLDEDQFRGLLDICNIYPNL